MFDLCLALGCEHPDFLNLNARQIIDWEAYNTIKPLGDTRGDFRAAMICSTLVNLKRTKGKPPAKPSDFMPFMEKPKQTFADMKRIIQRAAGV